jgi:DNA-binding phage protein
MITPREAMQLAASEYIKRAGGLSMVARAAGVSRQAVLKWKKHGIPPARVTDLRKAFPRVAIKAAVGAGR